VAGPFISGGMVVRLVSVYGCGQSRRVPQVVGRTSTLALPAGTARVQELLATRQGLGNRLLESMAVVVIALQFQLLNPV